MAGFKMGSRSWLIFAAFLLDVYGTIATEGSGLTAVIESDQEFQLGYFSAETVTNWVHSGRSGLFMTEDLTKTENSTFTVTKDGIYYVTAYLVIETKRQLSSSYSNTVTLSGEIKLHSDEAYVPYNKQLQTYIKMGNNEQKNMRITGYVQLKVGWKVSVTLDIYSYWYGSWKQTVKSGSTFSMMYVSNPSMFPGVLLRSHYVYLRLQSPSYSVALVDWYEIDEGTSFPTSEGNFIIPRDGLYHIMVNLIVRLYHNAELKFNVMINNKTDAITKTTKLTSGRNAITLEGILNLNENQTISIIISDPGFNYHYLRITSESTFFIFSKGELKNRSAPALAVNYKSSSTKLSANRFSILKNWNTTSKHSLDHYGNVQLKQGEFVASKQGIYQINFALYISNCSNAVARISLQSSNEKSYQATGPDMGFAKESNDCHLENSWLLSLNTSDTVRLEVKSDMKYTVLPLTSYQIIYMTEYFLWPSAIFQLAKLFKFSTNTQAAKVQDWSYHNKGNWNDMFFKVYKEMIVVKVPGLYMVSYNLVVQTTSIGLFYSKILKNGAQAVDDSLCKRGETPQMFTCTSSTLLNLIEKEIFAVQVWMKDGSKKKQSVEILTSTRLTVSLLGDVRSCPSFKLNTKPPSTPYTSKAKKTVTKSLIDFTLPNTSYFQSAALYSKSSKAFNSANDYGFVLLNNLQFDLENDGYLASIIGTEDNNMTVYSKDPKKSHFSLAASHLHFGSQFSFNVSGEAKKSDLKWKPETGSVVSGVGIGNSKDVIFLKAQMKPQRTLKCFTDWKLVGVLDWDLGQHSDNFGKITKSGIQITNSGFYLTTLNFAVTSNNSNTVIDVGIFIDKERELSAKDTSPTDGKFSLFLQGVLEVRHGQNIDIKVKCAKPTTITCAKGGGIFAFKVDKPQTASGARTQLRANYKHDDEIGTYYPTYWYGYDKGFEAFQIGITNNDWRITVPRNGIYLIAVVGHNGHTQQNFEIAFSSPANDSKTSVCSLNSSPLYYQTTSDHIDNSIALTGFALLNTDEISGFIWQYDYWGRHYDARLYASMQYVGDIDTSSAFAATLQSVVTLKTGKNHVLKEKSWKSDKNCGKFSTKDVPDEFDKYEISYTGYYLVSVNFVLNHKDGCDFNFCFTIDGKVIKNGGGITGLNVGCFQQHLKRENDTRTSTVSGSELLYLEEGDKLSIQMDTTCGIRISKKSSFSAFYLGTSASILGFSSVLRNNGELRELPSLSFYYSRHYYDDGDYTQFVIGGWKMALPNSKMFFQNRIFQKTPSKDIFVCPQDGIYLVVVKVNVNRNSKMNVTCNAKLELAVDGEVLKFAFKNDLNSSVNTLSFTTTLRLKKWQGVTVRLSSNRLDCSEKMTVESGSSLAMVYLDTDKDAFTLWPNIGPHIVEFPGQGTVYVREDHAKTAKLTCTAVGENDIKYQWKTFNDEVVSESSELDIRKLNDSSPSVKCVATMNGLIAESRFTWIIAVDPTIVFGGDYDNRTYHLPEKNETTGVYDYQDVLIFSAKQKKTGRYYWYWYRRINCTITSGNDNGTFSISRYYVGYRFDEDFFKLRARLNKLDREMKGEYNVEITCENLEYEDAVKAKTVIKVLILDANDNLPVFEKEFYETTVKKNIRSGEDIIQVQASDDDINENGKIVYSLRHTVTSYIFRMDKKAGVLSLKNKEKLSDPAYTLTAIATDHGHPPRSSYVTILLKVQDVQPPTANHTNKNPVFKRKVYTEHIPSSTPKGSFITTVLAHDPDSYQHNEIIYYIRAGDVSVFEIDPKRGEIKTKAAVKPPKYYLTIAAEYKYPSARGPQGEYYNTTLVIIYIDEVDNNRPTFMKSHYACSIPEDSQTKREVIKVTAVYQGKKVKYSIPTKGPFGIDKNSGMITVAGKLDYEQERNFTFVVSATDVKDRTKSTCTDVTVHVSDVNDNAPVFMKYQEQYKVDTVMGNNNKIDRFSATDKDEGTNGEIRYYLRFNHNGLFSINNVSGILYRNGNLSCCKTLTLEIIAKDQGEPPKERSIIIKILPQQHSQHTGGGGGHTGAHSGSSSSKKKYIIIGVVGGLAIILILVGVIYWRRKRRQLDDRNPVMRYIGLISDKDDPLLDDGSYHNDDDTED